MDHTIQRLERGCVLTKLYPKGKPPEKRTFCVRRELRQMIWQLPVGGKNQVEGCVNFREIKEIRIGRTSKVFEKWQEDAKKWELGQCFVVLYGSSFRLKNVSCVGKYLVFVLLSSLFTWFIITLLTHSS